MAVTDERMIALESSVGSIRDGVATIRSEMVNAAKIYAGFEEWKKNTENEFTNFEFQRELKRL